MRGAVKSSALLLMVFLLLLTPRPAGALEERLLVLPPAAVEEGCPEPSLDTRWGELLSAVDLAVAGAAAVPAGELLALWQGDTLSFDALAVDEALNWGNVTGADRVLLVEWGCGEGGPRPRGRIVDPFTGEAGEILAADDGIALLRRLFPDRWIYDAVAETLPPDYRPPGPKGGAVAVSRYLRERKTYPPEALIRAIGADLPVTVVVAPQGVPVSVEVGAAVPEGYGFEDAVEQALWALRYRPATVGGKGVYGVYRAKLRIVPVP